MVHDVMRPINQYIIFHDPKHKIVFIEQLSKIVSPQTQDVHEGVMQ